MLFKFRKNKTDEELMALIGHGDSYALTELYNRYKASMVRYFYRMLWRDDSKANDFLHDLFVKIIDHPQYFDATRKFSTWIYSVAFNMCKNEYRKQNFRKEIHHTLSRTAVIEISQPSPDEREFRNQLEAVLGQADESDRNLFVLKYVLEMPIPQIAEMTGLAEGTVKSRLFYFKKKLSEQLQVFNPAINQ